MKKRIKKVKRNQYAIISKNGSIQLVFENYRSAKETRDEYFEGDRIARVKITEQKGEE